MYRRALTQSDIAHFAEHLLSEEKSTVTSEKYLRDVRRFHAFAAGRRMSKQLTMEWKKTLTEQDYAVRSVNSMLASVNSFLSFLGFHECKVKNIRMQRQIYCPESTELSKAEYLRLLEASEKDPQLNLAIQTICATGIRVSELKYFTVEAVRSGEVTVFCKAKNRTILLPGKLRKKLQRFAKDSGVGSGEIFIGKNGTSLDRSVLWRKMKRLCTAAGVQASKVFPHNLRKLFARTFYSIERDIAKLADILGHGSINTTRIYLMSSGAEHRRKIERLGLLV